MIVVALRSRYHSAFAAIRRLPGAVALRWRRSMQLRVTATTALVSAVVVVIVGIVLVGQISAGLLDTKRRAALAQASGGASDATQKIAVETSDNVAQGLTDLVGILAAKGSNAGLFYVVIVPPDTGQQPVGSGGVDESSIPSGLIRLVNGSQQAYQYGRISRHVDSDVVESFNLNSRNLKVEIRLGNLHQIRGRSGRRLMRSAPFPPRTPLGSSPRI